ncbi:MAG: hypothetical protein ACR2GX_09810 [Candidatus Dormibacteria bacterium]
MPSIFLDFERTLSASPSDVRARVQNTLRELAFQTTTAQVTLIEAKRGHPLVGSLLGTSNVPVRATATITPEGDGAHVVIRLADNHASLGRTWGANGAYQKAFAEIQQRIDEGLGQLDPEAAPQFAASQFISKSGTVGVLETGNRVTSDFSGAAVGKVNQMLSGGPRTRVPNGWKQLDTVVLCADEGAARLQLEELQAHLAVAMFISSQPGSLPLALAGQVEALATRIEAALGQAGASRYIEIPISDAEEPVVEFLHQQARMRQQFAVRTLHRCRTCKFEKITNPDFERLQKRNSRLRALGGSVGATFGKSGISPFILVGTLFRFAKLDPDYVCPRCQGTDAEAMVVTFCPDCGALRPEAALRGCAKCHLDMRTKLTPHQVWEPYPEPPMPPALGPAADPAGFLPIPAMAGTALPVPVPGSVSTPQQSFPDQPAVPAGTLAGSLPSPPPPPPPPPPPVTASGPRVAASGAKICSTCGGEFATLYRAVVANGGAQQTLYVCGRPPGCTPRSEVTPAPV